MGAKIIKGIALKGVKVTISVQKSPSTCLLGALLC